MERIELEDVYQGPIAIGVIMTAFLKARGNFNVSFYFGVDTAHPGQLLVLVEINGARATFTPDELREMGENVVRYIPKARALGAPERAERELRNFAMLLIEAAEHSRAMSPFGLH
jgi:hypothetical protein